MNEDVSDVVRKEISQLKSDLPMVIAMEELAELQQAISKGIRGKLNKDNLTEEIADVCICINWVIDKFHINADELYKWVDYKNDRCLKRLNDGDFK